MNLAEVESQVDKLAPHSLEAERAVLGGMLLDEKQIGDIADILHPDDFYRSQHARLYKLLLERSWQNCPVDMVGIADYLLSIGQEEAYGGIAYISCLPEQVPATENLTYYAKLIQEKSLKRKMLRAHQSVIEKIQSGEMDSQEILGYAEQQILELSSKKESRSWVQLKESIHKNYDRLVRISDGEESAGIPTGFKELDALIGGLQKPDLLILAARPAMGKTSLMMNIVKNVALNFTAGVFSMEMATEQLSARLWCEEAKIFNEKMRTGIQYRSDWAALEDAAEKLYHRKIFIDDTPALSIFQLHSRARRLKMMCPDLGLIAVDYLQLMQSGSGRSSENREQEISTISRSLKALAKELKVPVLALSQLNRGVESRQDKRPMVSDLRDSGAIEQDADIIMFIYRDEYYNQDSNDRGKAEVIVAKQRNGPLGTAVLGFNGSFTQFYNL